MDTILIVDDTPANLSVLLRCLTDANYRVLVAEDGEEALEQVTLAPPDLILLDVMMPGLDGFETCRRLRATPTTRDIPVIFMTALTDTREKLQGFAAGAVDYITKPVQHEEALARMATHLKLRRLQRELAAELKLKERFMRIAAHDLRNPLCLIMMASGVARRSQSRPEALQRSLHDIDASARHMRGIIDTFLQLRPGDRRGTLHLPALVEGVVSQYRASAEAKGQSLDYEPPAAAMPAVRGDATELFQVVTNYLSNSVKFTPPGGRVIVRIVHDDIRVRFEVADNGPGVPPAERDRLFTEFARLSPRPTGGEESHGMGLAIVRQLAEANGATVGADFPAGGGSVFWCEWPAIP